MADLSKILRSMADDLEPAGNFRKNILDAADTIERLKASCADLGLILRRRNSADHDKRMRRPNTWDGVVIDEWTDETKPPTSD